MQITKRQNSTNRHDKIVTGIILSLIVSVFLGMFMGSIINFIDFLGIFFIVTIIFLLVDIINNYSTYDGWEIENDFLVITRANYINDGFISKKLNYKEIDEIKYCKAVGRIPENLKIISRNEEYEFLPDEDITSILRTLKYFQNQGIKISLAHKDEQIENYLNLGMAE